MYRDVEVSQEEPQEAVMMHEMQRAMTGGKRPDSVSSDADNEKR